MKRAVIAGVLLLLSIVAIFFGVQTVFETSSTLYSLSGRLLSSIHAQDERSPLLFGQLLEQWEASERRLITLIGRIHTDPAALALSRAQVFFEMGERSDAIAELEEFLRHIERLWSSEAMLWENLF